MNFRETSLPGVIVIEPKVFGDERGFFMETFHRDKFAGAGLPTDFVQDNHSRSAYGTLRGLHFQNPQPQGKLVRAIEGAIFDVAVDIRTGSPTFGQWAGVELTAENKYQLWVPPDFAHGFCVISETAEVVYKCTDVYAPECERALAWDDPDIAIDWPIEVPILSERDRQGVPLNALDGLPNWREGSA